MYLYKLICFSYAIACTIALTFIACPTTSYANLYSIQIGSFVRKENAQEVFKELSGKGYPVFIEEKSNEEGAVCYNVCIGRFDSKSAADAMVKRLRSQDGFHDCIVIAQTQEKSTLPAASDKSLMSSVSQKRDKEENSTILKDKKNNHGNGIIFTPSRSFFAEGIPFKIYAEIEPRFSWELYYEDNVYATAENHVSDFSNRYKPNIKVNFTTERLKIASEGELEIIEYVDERDYNTVDQDYIVTLSYQLDKRSIISIAGSYSVNTDPNRYFQLEPEDIGSLALVGTYVVKKYKTKTKTATGTYQYIISPLSTIMGTFAYSNFDTGVTDSTDFYMGLLQYQHDLSKKVKFNLMGSYNYMRFKFGGKAEEGDIEFLEDLVSGGDYDVFFGSDFKSKMYSANAGFAYMFRKGSNINASLGCTRNIQNIKTETIDPETGELITETRRPDGNALNYNLGYIYSFSATTIKLNLKQSAGDNANTGASYRSRDLEFRFIHDIDRRLTGNLTLKYYRYHSDEDDFGFEIKRHILYIMSSITYRATRWLNISLNYQYTNNHNKNIGRRIERNSVFAALTFQPLRPFVFR